MRKIKYIIVIMIVTVFLLSNNIHAKYKYVFEKTVFNLTRDGQNPQINVKYSETSWTNEDILVTLISDKEIEIINEEKDWMISEDNKSLRKTVTKNVSGALLLEDIFGNVTEIPYEVSNIDKEPPKIIGVENGKTYSSDIILDYTDNVGIEDIYINKYADLKVECLNDYHDTGTAYGIDVDNSSIKVKITSYPKGTKYFKYYLNEDLYMKTEEKEYRFSNIESGVWKRLKVEAIDKDDKVIETRTQDVRAVHFTNLVANKTDTGFTVTYYGIDSRIKKISYAIWNDGNKSGTEKWVYNQTVTSDRTFTASFKFDDYGFASDIYKMHLYFLRR